MMVKRPKKHCFQGMALTTTKGLPPKKESDLFRLTNRESVWFAEFLGGSTQDILRISMGIGRQKSMSLVRSPNGTSQKIPIYFCLKFIHNPFTGFGFDHPAPAGMACVSVPLQSRLW